MASIVVGHPEVVQGAACSDKNPYVQKLLMSKAVKYQKEHERQQQNAREYEQELDKIIKALNHEFERNRLDGTEITLRLRLRHVHCSGMPYDNPELLDRLNMKLAPIGVKIRNIYIPTYQLYDDDVSRCVATSVCCCCIPLLFWLPKFWIDEKYGKCIEMRFSFQC